MPGRVVLWVLLGFETFSGGTVRPDDGREYSSHFRRRRAWGVAANEPAVAPLRNSGCRIQTLRLIHGEEFTHRCLAFQKAPQSNVRMTEGGCNARMRLSLPTAADA